MIAAAIVPVSRPALAVGNCTPAAAVAWVRTAPQFPRTTTMPYGAPNYPPRRLSAHAVAADRAGLRCIVRRHAERHAIAADHTVGNHAPSGGHRLRLPASNAGHAPVAIDLTTECVVYLGERCVHASDAAAERSQSYDRSVHVGPVESPTPVQIGRGGSKRLAAIASAPNEQDGDRDQTYIDVIAFLVQNGETDAALGIYHRALSRPGRAVSEYVKVYTSLWVLDLSRRTTKLTDQKADELANGRLALESQLIDLKKKYYQRFKAALSAKMAAKFLQIENQLLSILDLQIASSLPIVE